MAGRAAQWRTLSAAEREAYGDLRYGGMLGALVACAALLLALPMFAVAGGVAGGGLEALVGAVSGLLDEREAGATVQSLYAIPQAAITLWALGFLLAVVTRLPAIATLSGVLLGMWIVLGTAVDIAARRLFGAAMLDAGLLSSLLPGVALRFVTVAAIQGYLMEGFRPNIAFRGRIRIG